MFLRPERHFVYLSAANPAIGECLLVPFHVDGVPVGTIWAITHEPDRQFDSEDARVLEDLSGFTSLAYKTLVEIGALGATHWARAQREPDRCSGSA